MPTWPTSLQQASDSGSLALRDMDARVFSPVARGPAKLRPGVTSQKGLMRVSMQLDVTDYQTFKNFYWDTIQNGTLSFVFPNPITGTLYQWTFVDEPAVATIGPLLFRVVYTLEKVVT